MAVKRGNKKGRRTLSTPLWRFLTCRYGIDGREVSPHTAPPALPLTITLDAVMAVPDMPLWHRRAGTVLTMSAAAAAAWAVTTWREAVAVEHLPF